MSTQDSCKGVDRVPASPESKLHAPDYNYYYYGNYWVVLLGQQVTDEAFCFPTTAIAFRDCLTSFDV